MKGRGYFFLGIGGIFLDGIIGKIISKSLIRIIIEYRYLRSKNYEAPKHV